MKYQISISPKKPKLRKGTVRPPIRSKKNKNSKAVFLNPQLSIKGAAHWQKRIEELLPDCHATVHVAK